MSHKLPHPQVKVTIRLNEPDYAFLQAVLPPGKTNEALRRVVEAYCRRVREAVAQGKGVGL